VHDALLEMARIETSEESEVSDTPMPGMLVDRFPSANSFINYMRQPGKELIFDVFLVFLRKLFTPRWSPGRCRRHMGRMIRRYNYTGRFSFRDVMRYWAYSIRSLYSRHGAGGPWMDDLLNPVRGVGGGNNGSD